MLMILLLFAFQIKAQQDMKDMPGMKMSPPKKEIQKQVSKNTTINTGDRVIYTCVMHPKIQMDKPGNCPICGMKLVKKTIKSTPTKIIPENKEEMNMPRKDTSKKMDMNMKMDNDKEMKMDKDKPMDKSMDMGNMKMDKVDKSEMDKAKANLGIIKTIKNNTPRQTVRYDLYVRDTMVTFGKKSRRAIAVNGQIPMPTLTFTEGDTAEIWVHNEMNEETSLHWHGLFLPNKYDGVPNLTQMPIKPHTTHLYKYPIVQHGTHWYHSHTGLQEQIGMYGAFIMNKRIEWDIPTIPVVLSEWTDMKPEEVHRSLKNQTDWFAIQKGTTQSYAEAIKKGQFKTKVTNEWKPIPPFWWKNWPKFSAYVGGGYR